MVSAVACAGLAPEELFAPYEWVCELGGRPNPLGVVRQRTPGARPKLFVAEHFAGVARSGNAAGAAFVGEARRLSTLASPNLGRVRELVVRGDDLVAFWEFVDGEKLVEMWSAGGIPLDVALRLILDVLSGVGSIHGLRDAKQRPMALAHGEVSPATIVVGVDGTAKVLHAIGRRLPGARGEPASLGYLAPEVHAGEAFDARADVFSVGVMLWEALSARRLFTEEDAAAIVARVRSAGVEQAAAPGKSSWATGLALIAAKALAADPADRWPTASAMAAEIRKAAGLRLAPATTAATFAKTGLGERAKERRERLESRPAGIPRIAAPPVLVAPVLEPAAAGIDTEIDLVSDSLVPPVAVPRAIARPVAPPLAPPLPARAFKPPPPEPLPAEPVPAEPPLLELVPAEPPLLELVPAEPPPLELVPAEPLPLEPLPAAEIAPDDRAVLPSPSVWSAEQAASVPYFEAAVDVPVTIAASEGDMSEIPSLSNRPSAEIVPFGRVDPRRTVAVLGGVAAVGLIVFSLAAWRVAHRADAPMPSLPPSLPQAAHVQAVPPGSARAHSDWPSGWQPVAPTATPAQPVDPEAATAAPTSQAAAVAPTPPTATRAETPSRTPRSLATPRPPSVPKPTSAAPPARKSATPRPTHPTPRPTSGFDPGSL